MRNLPTENEQFLAEKMENIAIALLRAAKDENPIHAKKALANAMHATQWALSAFRTGAENLTPPPRKGE